MISLLDRWRRALLGRVTGAGRDENFVGFDKYRKHGPYHWRELEKNPEYREKIDLVGALLHEEATCLDLGCGDGAYVSVLASKCRRIVGVDADPHAVRLANRGFGSRGLQNARAFQLPLSRVTLEAVEADRLFDVVYSMDVLEHLPNPAQLLEVATSMSHPAGRIVIGTPLYIDDSLVSPYHVREFRVEELRILLGRHLRIDRELVLPMLRQDGRVHDRGFFVAVGASLGG